MQQTDESVRPFRFAMFVLFTGLITATIVLVTRFSLSLWMEAANEPDKNEGVATHLNFRIGEQPFSIPANMVEQALPEGEDLQKGRIDLAMQWPQMIGRNEENRLAFADMTRSAPILQVMLRLHSDPVSPSQRFERIFRPAFFGEPLDAPNGLTGILLAEGSGYGGEVLYYDQTPGDARFSIRCNSLDTRSAPAECLRHMQLSAEIALEYRFRIGLLPQWREIEKAVLALSKQIDGS